MQRLLLLCLVLFASEALARGPFRCLIKLKSAELCIAGGPNGGDGADGDASPMPGMMNMKMEGCNPHSDKQIWGAENGAIRNPETGYCAETDSLNINTAVCPLGPNPAFEHSFQGAYIKNSAGLCWTVAGLNVGLAPCSEDPMQNFEVTCAGNQASPSPDQCATDLMIVADASSSITPANWAVMKLAIKAQIATTEFTGMGGSRIGVTTFAAPGTAGVKCALSYNKAELDACVDLLAQPPAALGTDTPAGLKVSRLHLQEFSSSDCIRAVEVITDGKSMDSEGESLEAQTLNEAQKLKDDGVIIIALGIGTGLNSELIGMASGEGVPPYDTKAQYVAAVDNFGQLDGLTNLIAPECPPKIPPTPSPSPSDCTDGTVVLIDCPYLSILMEHCYQCFQPPALEVMVCDGWDEEAVRQQCNSGEPIGSKAIAPKY